MAIDWFRSYHGAPTDPKWLWVARKAQTVPGVVSAVWFALEDYASQNPDRGSVAGFDVETYAAFSGFEEETVAAICAALRHKGVIGDDDRLAAWARRQPKREDDSAQRVREHRARQRGTAVEPPADPAPPSAPPPAPVTSPPDVTVTPCNAPQRAVTPEESRGEETREEETTPSSSASSPRLAREREKVLAAAAGGGQLEPGQEDAEPAMRVDLLDWLDAFLSEDRLIRNRFALAAGPVIGGLDRTAWTDPKGDGGGVPWAERRELLQLALVKCAAERAFGANDLHSAVRYVVLQQRNPTKAKRSGGSENEMPGTERAGHRGAPHDLRPISGGKSPNDARLERDAAEARLVAEYLEKHPTERTQLEAEVEAELAAVPGAKELPGWILKAQATSKLRGKVLERLKLQPPPAAAAG